MSPGADRERAEGIFADALELRGEKREAFVLERCGADAALESAVRGLLRDASAAGMAFLDPEEIRRITAAGSGVRAFTAESVLAPGMRLGGYVIGEKIGAGGMGVVYTAEQERPRRTVALKVIRRGLGTEGILRRFEHEAEALGRLQHPGIAQIYEAGAADVDGVGHPFIAMELVRGKTLVEHAAGRQLSSRERLALVAEVCDAVHHAHQRGVIHRDLKPANILVDEAGRPKVLDFGVARMASADAAFTTLRTSVGQLIGTLSYMSPEQVVGDPSAVDTRSDVYSLGVVLYELLAGRLPHDLTRRSLPEAARIIREESPARLSQVSRVLRGDVETIALRALEKNPDERYQSAGALADDIRRFLRGEPIVAKQDSALYVLRKQIGRHKVVAASVLVVLAGLIGFAVYAAANAEHQKQLSQASDKARQEAVLAKDAAERATSAATLAKEEADLARARAVEELSYANIERGRMAGLTGNLPLAEDILWRERVTRPEASEPVWALRELYDRFPSKWIRRVGESARAARSADQRVMLVAGINGTLLVIDPTSGRTVYSPPRVQGEPAAIAVDPSGLGALIGLARGGVQYVPLRGQTSTLPLRGLATPAPVVRSVAISPDGRWFATGGSDRRVYVWDAGAGELVCSWELPQVVLGMTFTRDSAELVVPGGATDQGTVSFWSVADGRMTREFPAPLGLRAELLETSGDGRRVYVGTRAGASIAMDVQTGARLYGLDRSKGLGGVFSESPDGSRVFVSSFEQCALLNARTGERIAELPTERFMIRDACWTSSSEVTIATQDGVIRHLGMAPFPSTTAYGAYPSWCFAATYSGDGRVLAIAEGYGSIEFYDAASRGRVSTFRQENRLPRIRGIKFLPDHRTLVSAGQDGMVRVIDSSSGAQLRAFETRRSEAYAMDVDPSGSLVAVGHGDRHAAIYRVETGALVAELPVFQKRVEGLAFSPTGELLAVSGRRQGITLWNVAGQRVEREIETASAPWAVAFSPDGSTVYATTQAGTVEVVEAATGTRVDTLRGHQRLAPGLAVSRDGRFLASAGEDGIVRLWDARTRRGLASFNPEASVIVTLAFHPDSSRLAASAAFYHAYEFDLTATAGAVERQEPYFRERMRSQDGTPRTPPAPVTR